MMTLVMGGSASGKSAFAEGLACEAAGEGLPLYYLATMKGGSPAAQARIERHLEQRAGKGFQTVEAPTLAALGQASLDPQGAALLDDLGNLVANEMFAGDVQRTADPEGLAGLIATELEKLSRRVAHLAVVADEVGMGGWHGDDGTRAWIECCGACCCKLASQAARVYQVTCGIATELKGRA